MDSGYLLQVKPIVLGVWERKVGVMIPKFGT